jgi:hypothetical protein
VVGFVRAVRPAGLWRNPFAVCCALGVGAVVVHSLFDLPFRSPGVLYAWLAILAAAPAFALPAPALLSSLEPPAAGEEHG